MKTYEMHENYGFEDGPAFLDSQASRRLPRPEMR
jgi:hypothetical protein